VKVQVAVTREAAATLAAQAARAEWDNTAPGKTSYIDVGGKRIVIDRTKELS
jgi:hypothetical protein